MKSRYFWNVFLTWESVDGTDFKESGDELIGMLRKWVVNWLRPGVRGDSRRTERG
jgi:hypothetical protein